MARQIFRKEALDRLASPDRLDQLMPLTSVRGWIALFGFVVLAAVAAVWGVYGSVAVTVEGVGVLTRPGAITNLTTSRAGTFTKISVEPGDPVKPGQKLAEVKPPDDPRPLKPLVITSNVTGRVLSLLAREGDSVIEGAELIKLESNAKPLQVILFVPVADAARVNRDQTVRIWFGTSTSQSDAKKGKVKSVARFPASRTQLIAALQSEEWAATLLTRGPSVEVVADFEATDGQFSGTPCRAEITVARQSPLQMIWPKISNQ